MMGAISGMMGGGGGSTLMGSATAIGGSLLGYFGAREQNKTNKQMAKADRAFQERMSSTAYQRGMADMREAGLNPMLAYKQGGASSPSGSLARAENVGAAAVRGFEDTMTGVTSGKKTSLANQRLKQEIRNMKAGERKLIAEEVLTRQQTTVANHSAKNLYMDHLYKTLRYPDAKRGEEFKWDNPRSRKVSRGMEMFGIKSPTVNISR